MNGIYGITTNQVDELIEQADKLVGICELLLGGNGSGDLTISRNNLCTLLGDPAYKVRAIAKSARPVDVQLSLS